MNGVTMPVYLLDIMIGDKKRVRTLLENERTHLFWKAEILNRMLKRQMNTIRMLDYLDTPTRGWLLLKVRLRDEKERLELAPGGRWVVDQVAAMTNIRLWSLFTEAERDNLRMLRLNRDVHWNDKTDHIPPRATKEFK
jgi:hypothetical protein